MRRVTAEVLLMLVGMMATAIGSAFAVSWALQGRLTTIEASVAPVPGLAKDVVELKIAAAKQEEINKKIDALKEPLANTQANVRKILKQNKATAAASPFNLGPFGAR